MPKGRTLWDMPTINWLTKDHNEYFLWRIIQVQDCQARLKTTCV